METKPINEYYRRSDLGYKNQTYCKECMKTYNKKRYARYKAKKKGAWYL